MSDKLVGRFTALVQRAFSQNMEKFANAGPNLFFQIVLNENGNTITYNYGVMEGYAGN